MNMYLLLVAVVIVMCVLLNRISGRFGVPMLFAFIALGMFFGSDGVVKIPFENYEFADNVCSIALIFIMFYGGFGTNWNEAKPVALKAGLLSSAGVVMTALITGLFCRFIMGFELLESFLIGSIIGSTDAASVFSILRSRRLNLKERTASLLEVESGSNDPFAYMLTVVVMSMIGGGFSAGSIVRLLLSQIVFGVMFGVLIALAAGFVLKKFRFATEGFDAAFVLAVALLSYALPNFVGGNGYLSAYIVGIMLGNMRIQNKRSLVHFFDGLTGLMQMCIFFLLGLLSFPSRLPQVILPAAAIALFLTFVARPAAVFSIMLPFRCSLRQMMLVSWSGLRGAASIVFSIIAMLGDTPTTHDVFHIVFCIVLLSIAFQGTLIAPIARRLGMVDDNGDVLKTFNDYANEAAVSFIRLPVSQESGLGGKRLRDISFPPDMLVAMILRGKKRIVPKGSTVILPGDTLVIGAPEFMEDSQLYLTELEVTQESYCANKKLCEIEHKDNELVVMIKRDGHLIIPRGQTTLLAGDVLVIGTSDD